MSTFTYYCLLINWTFSQIHAFIEAPAVIRDAFAKQKTIVDPFQIAQGVEVEQFSSVLSFSISDIKAIAKKHGASFNAVLISIYGNGIGKYLFSKQDTLLDTLIMATPQPWPGRPKNFIGNHYNLMTSVVPLKASSPIESLDQVQAQITDFYLSRAFIINKYILINLHSIFPSWILGSLLAAALSRCVLSPILGHDDYVYNGRSVLSSTPLAGMNATSLGK